MKNMKYKKGDLVKVITTEGLDEECYGIIEGGIYEVNGIDLASFGVYIGDYGRLMYNHQIEKVKKKKSKKGLRIQELENTIREKDLRIQDLVKQSIEKSLEQIIDKHAQNLKSWVGTLLAKEECVGLIKNAVDEALILSSVSQQRELLDAFVCTMEFDTKHGTYQEDIDYFLEAHCKHENEIMSQGDGFVYSTCDDCGDEI